MQRHVPLLGALVVGAALTGFTFAPAQNPAPRPVDPPAKQDEKALADKVRELEERLTRVEKKLAAQFPAADTVPVGELVSNLKEDRLQRYFRCKIALLVDEADQNEVTVLVTKKRAELKSWALAYLADMDLKSVSGSQGHERLRDAFKRAFGKILFPDKANRIKDVLFEEYVVQ